ncbi:hypothetical protein [Pseudalkalibacillus caeni]|nr:hypothetical protein [Pseudalkalibacillus caeni]
MKELDNYPKSLTKAIRYIKQDAPPDKLKEIQKIVNYAIEKRMTNAK